MEGEQLPKSRQQPEKAVKGDAGLWHVCTLVVFPCPSPAVFAFQVKQIMEEAVTRKFVHEDSSHIISFCGESVARGCEKWLLSLWAALGKWHLFI